MIGSLHLDAVLLLAVLASVPLIVTVLAIMWLTRRDTIQPGRVISGVWIDARDERHYAGCAVACDTETEEIIAAARDVPTLKAEMRQRFTGRLFFAVQIPGEMTDAMRTTLYLMRTE